MRIFSIWFNLESSIRMDIVFKICGETIFILRLSQNENNNSKRGTEMFIAALFTLAKIQKQARCPSINDWIKKKQYIYISQP